MSKQLISVTLIKEEWARVISSLIILDAFTNGMHPGWVLGQNINQQVVTAVPEVIQ